MVTGDEKWVTYDNIVRNRSWSKCGEAAQKGGQTRTNGQEGSTVYLVRMERNHLLGVASALPNTKFRSLLPTTGSFEASDCPEISRIGQQKRCCVPSGQRQNTYFCRNPP
ncbi:hypothetical protein TNCV_899841 [Trichonephila clavipes]|nr:hypothetical protein TNCV_899841 [Trichonephila clavipes]